MSWSESGLSQADRPAESSVSEEMGGRRWEEVLKESNAFFLTMLVYVPADILHNSWDSIIQKDFIVIVKSLL